MQFGEASERASGAAVVACRGMFGGGRWAENGFVLLQLHSILIYMQ